MSRSFFLVDAVAVMANKSDDAFGVRDAIDYLKPLSTREGFNSVFVLDARSGDLRGICKIGNRLTVVSFNRYGRSNAVNDSDLATQAQYVTHIQLAISNLPVLNSENELKEQLAKIRIRAAAGAKRISISDSSLAFAARREANEVVIEPMGLSSELSNMHGLVVDDNLLQGIIDDIEDTRGSTIHWQSKALPPSRTKLKRINRLLIKISFPGYQEDQPFDKAVCRKRLLQLHRLLATEIKNHLIYRAKGNAPRNIELIVQSKLYDFLAHVPTVRRKLAKDVAQALEEDPAASQVEDVVLCNPGVTAITIYRFANVLARLQLPLLARMMMEIVHSETGIDIHPEATIGEGFSIDHGTGVVVGQTTTIGNNCSLYQGVTLGALRFERDDRGNLLRGADHKRHPTLGDNVKVFANASVLGGNTSVGPNSMIGANVRLTRSVLPESIVTIPPEDPKIRKANTCSAELPPKTKQPSSAIDDVDFII